MGLYIKNMEMPKYGCDHCFLRTGNYCGRIEKNEPVVEYARKSERHPDCPLVPVPPHGKLIDANALTETMDGIWDCNDLYFQPNDKICDPVDCKGCKWHETMDCCKRMVKHAPTIIPAEEGEA